MFSIVGPRVQGVFSWADISYLYLVALRSSGIRPRVIPIGGAGLPAKAKSDRAWAHWVQLRDAFEGDLGDVRVNVVCVPLGIPLGRRVTAATFLDNRSAEDDDPLVEGLAPVAKTPDAVVYDPTTALAGLWTAGMVNIAITGRLAVAGLGWDLEFLKTGTLADGAITAKRPYDLVLCPEVKDMTWLADQGIEAQWCSPPRLAVDACKMPCFADVLAMVGQR